MTTNDRYALSTLNKLEQWLGDRLSYRLSRGGLILEDYDVILAKKKTRFRPLGILDYAHFTVKGLATAITEERVMEYYEEMLQDPRSPSSEWRDKELEMRLKSYYGERREGEDPHIGCFSYPECDLSPTGCVVLHGSDAEPFGYKD